MIGKESITYAMRNMKHSWARSALTIFSIFIGITTIFIFISFGWGIQDYAQSLSTSSSADKLMIQAKGSGAPGLDDSFKLTDDDVNAVEKAAGIYSASGVYFSVVQTNQNKEQGYTFLVAYDPGNPLIMDTYNIGLEQGRDLEKNDVGKVILGYNYLFPDKIFSKAYKINDKIEINGIDMRVIGFMEEVGSPPDDAQIYTTNEYFEQLFPNKTYGMIVARADITDIEKVVDNVEKKLRKSRGLEEGEEDFYVQSFDALIESFSSAINIIMGFVILIALISVVVSAVNTANTMITSVLERYKEIGILKSIGARNSEIFGIFLFESAFLGLVSGIVGVFFGWLLSDFGGNLLSNLGWGFLQPHYSSTLFIGCILFATITGAISGVAPAYRASKINAVDALRYE